MRITAIRRTPRGIAVVLILGLALFGLLTGTALADGICTQTDGQVGFYDGTTNDDAGCITEAEYAEMFSVGNLAETGVLANIVDNGDGTVTGLVTSTGGMVTLLADPLDRPLAANTNPVSPAFESDSPTIGDYWSRLHELTGGGPQE